MDTMSRARKHHYVPQVYLRQWATDGQVVARRRQGEPFPVALGKILHEIDLYTTEGTDGPSDEVERWLSQYEGLLPDALRSLRMGHIPTASDPHRRDLAQLLALQYVRTPDRRMLTRLPGAAIARAGHNGPFPEDLLRDLFLEHVGREPRPDELDGLADFLHYSARPEQRVDRNHEVAISFASADRIADSLVSRHWSVESSKGMPFVTSDRPIQLWCRNPPKRRGVGIELADEIRFVVSPHHLLVMRRHGVEVATLAPRRRVAEVNQHTASTCWRTVVGRPRDFELTYGLALRGINPVIMFRRMPIEVDKGSGRISEVHQGLRIYTPYDDRS